MFAKARLPRVTNRRRWGKVAGRAVGASVVIWVAACALGACARQERPAEERTLNEPVEAIEPILPIPLEAPGDPKLVRLGEELFFDTILSQDGKVSCGSCHSRERALTDGLPRSAVPGRPPTLTNAPTVFNVRYFYKLGWFGHADSLESHLDGLIKSPKLMGTTWSAVAARLSASPAWARRFGVAFADGVSAENVRRALIAYERSLTTPNSPFDRWLRGERGALSPAAEQGYAIFKSYGCASCHQGVAVGGNLLQPLGVMREYFDTKTRRESDAGRFSLTRNEEDQHVFRVPSLRNVALTAPYFHDGSVPSLEEAVAIMARYQIGRELGRGETDALVAFLKSLTGEYRGRSL